MEKSSRIDEDGNRTMFEVDHAIAISPEVTEFLPPLINGKTARRITRHDSPRAQEITANGQVFIDLLGSVKKNPARCLKIGACRQGKDKAVILIGQQGLLMTPFAAKNQPHPARSVGKFQFRKLAIDDLHDQAIRQLGDNPAVRINLQTHGTPVDEQQSRRRLTDPDDRLTGGEAALNNAPSSHARSASLMSRNGCQ